MPRLPALPDLDWTEDGQPRARAYDDVYFSKAGGLAEARAVFLAGCGLPEAWAGRARFAIGELGFGAGLNALAVWDAWRRTRPPGGMLHFTSVEAFPLPREAAARALGAFPEIADLAVRLLAAWPVRAPAPQRLWFPEDGFALTVQIGEACGVLAGMTGAFDAWFLDGFAPARNEAMWRPELFSRVAALSAPGARAATYSVAGGVRRGLEAAGFAVEKRAGFAAKRERLEARLAKPPAAPAPLHPYASRMPARAVIIGGGIAGACLAHAFARRGTAVMLLEAEDLGAGASGAPAALVMPRLERGAAPLGRLHLAAYLEAVRLYESLGAFSAIGVEQGPANARERETFASLAADPPLPEDWLRAQPDGVLHPRAGLVAPAAALAPMTRAAEIRRGA
ncbi:MAG: tRNA (5-methylaminomethyl-2-thiouridine)(34)-methyltransferase MnmD, partial [Hyphomonadaceae bacterium]